jgi:hypothetical protein
MVLAAREKIPGEIKHLAQILRASNFAERGLGDSCAFFVA